MAPEVILRGACSSDNNLARICGSTEVVPYCKTIAPNSASGMHERPTPGFWC